MPQSPEEILREGARALGIVLTEVQVGLFLTYLEELKRWSRRINLTSIRTDREIIIKHFLDSLAPLSYVSIPDKAGVIDLGTGAGFPGLPLKIVRPDLALTLIDSSEKKVAFLHSLCVRLSLSGRMVSHCERSEAISGVEILHERVEDLAAKEEYQGLYDTAVARAFVPPGKVLPLALPLLKTGGRLLLYQGPREPSPEGWGHKHARLVQAVSHTLPLSSYRRRLVILERI